jgi:hypothetical protein
MLYEALMITIMCHESLAVCKVLECKDDPFIHISSI